MSANKIPHTGRLSKSGCATIVIMNTRQLFFSGIAILLQLPLVAYAAGLVPCGGTDAAGNAEAACQTCHVLGLINGVNAWLVGILSICAAIMFAVAGYRILTAGGNPSVLKEAKGMIVNVAIGFMIVLAAWILIDLMMKTLLGGEDTVAGPWNVIQCVAQPTAITAAGLLDLQLAGDSIGQAAGGSQTQEACAATPAGNINCEPNRLACIDGGGVPSDPIVISPENHSINCTYPATGYGGSCAAVSDASNPCHASNLSMFGSRAEEASIICNKESGGSPVKSGSDLCCGPGGNCSGAPSFSGGYFQINVLAHGDQVPGCTPRSFFTPNGSDSVQGNCVRRNGKGICTGWSCSITDRNMYNTCMKVTTDRALNFSIAEGLFNSRGFQPWSWSASICGIPH